MFNLFMILSKFKTNIFYSIIFLIFIFPSIVNAGEWKIISEQQSKIIFTDFIKDGPKIIYEKNKVDNKTKWHWAYNDTFSKHGWFAVQLYQLPNDWYINKSKVYVPKKQIKNVFNGKYKWLEKRKGFKSINRLANYRKFTNQDNGEKCFNWGINFSSNDAKWKESSNPFAILEGFFCRVKGYSDSEVERLINNIGAKDLREM
jgi:hypothetical protein